MGTGARAEGASSEIEDGEAEQSNQGAETVAAAPAVAVFEDARDGAEARRRAARHAFRRQHGLYALGVSAEAKAQKRANQL